MSMAINIKCEIIQQMKEKIKFPSVLKRLQTWFVKLSFWKKIILIFTLNTLILLILTDTIMLVLFGNISNDIISISVSDAQSFNTETNNQIIGSVTKKIFSTVEIYSNCLVQLSNSFQFFTKNPELYTSLQSQKPQWPNLTSSFSNQTFYFPGYYYLNSNSSFTPLPFIDQLLSKMIRKSSDMKNIKRINVYVQEIDNNNDLTARTIPGTNQFTIPPLQQITQRFQGITSNILNISNPYTDLSSKSSNEKLIALRSILNTSNTSFANKKIMMQIQLKLTAIQTAFQNTYYFPSAIFMMVSKSTNGYIFFSSPPSSYIINLLDLYYPTGNTYFTANGINYVTGSIGLANVCSFGETCTVTNQTNDPIRCIVAVDINQIQSPAIDINQFLRSESAVLKGIIFSWSFIIMLSTLALATVVGNYIFFNLKMLSTKMDEYIKNPSKFHLIVIQLKQLQLKGILKKLSDNVIGIIEKIEVRKRQRKDRVNQIYHPLSVGEPKFQERQQLNDYQIIQEIKEEVRIKVQAFKRQGEQRQRDTIKSSKGRQNQE